MLSENSKRNLDKKAPLVKLQGKTREYLRMCIDYTMKGKVKISMYEYIDKMLAELPSDMNWCPQCQQHYIY